MLKRVMIAAVAALAAGIFVASPTNADPGDSPCELAIAYFCKFVPVAPDLDHDLDLTQQPVDPNAPPPESLPATDPCAAGCI